MNCPSASRLSPIKRLAMKIVPYSLAAIDALTPHPPNAGIAMQRAALPREAGAAARCKDVLPLGFAPVTSNLNPRTATHGKKKYIFV